jgi:hypothetical protein
MSDAEYFEQRRTKSGPNVGKVMVAVNLNEMIGGLARIDSRTEIHVEAAMRYRNLFDRAQIGGAKALDYAAVKVDTSGPSELAVFEVGADARSSYSAAMRHLGMLRSSLVERIVCHDQSLGAVAGRSGAARARVRNDLFTALDDLAVYFKLTRRKAA